MFCLEYVEGWADVVTGRLLASHKSDILTEWAYSCICIGEGFDGYIVKNYRTVSEILGGSLHIFTLMPPSREVIEEEIRELRHCSEPQCQLALERLNNRLSKPYYRSQSAEAAMNAISSEVAQGRDLLRSQLVSAGLSKQANADFIFFEFNVAGDKGNYDIDVEALQAPKITPEDTDGYLRLFTRMSDLARMHREKKDSIDAFVKSLRKEWNSKIAFEKAFGAIKLAASFLDQLKLK